jgi:hypothetical protein
VPFWILQLAELLAAVALADLSLHVDRGGLLVAGTAVFALLAITAKGPLGLVRLVPRRLHVYFVCVVAVVFALAPIIPQIRPDASGIIIIVFGAVGLFRLATLTRTDLPVRAPRGSARPWVRPSAGDTPSGAGALPGSGSPGAEARGAVSPGSGSPGAVSPGSASDGLSTTEIAARLLGRGAKTAAHHAGTAVEAAALTAEKHGPAAKAQASRAVRSAGRLTGRLTRSAGSGSTQRSTPDSSGVSAAAGSPGSSEASAAAGSPEASAASAAAGSPGSAGSSGANEPPETAEVQGPEDPKQAAES